MSTITHSVAEARRRSSGTTRASQIEEFKALLAWPGLYRLSAVCDELLGNDDPQGGAESTMPTSLLLATSCAARIAGSRAGAVKLVGDHQVWNDIFRPVWERRAENEGLMFPWRPPTRDQVENFEHRLLDPEYKEVNKTLATLPPEVQQQKRRDRLARLARLQEEFQSLSMAQARTMGQFDRDTPIDWTQPSLKHTVIGDGTVIKPFSDVAKHVDPTTGEVFYRGSRAKTKPRLSPLGTDLTDDRKLTLRGLNMVSLLTSTRWGWVVLGTGFADGAEQWAALDLIDAVAPRSKGGINTLLWDRVFTGWLLDHMMARHSVRVVNKSVATNRAKNELPEDPTRTEAVRAQADEEYAELTDDGRHLMTLAEHRYAEMDAAKTWNAHTPSHQERQNEAALVDYWRGKDLAAYYESGRPLPLGLSIYPATSATAVTGSRVVTGNGEYHVVRSEPTWLTRHTHHGAQGSCTHELWIEDGALHSVEMDPARGCLVKTATATCLSSTPHKNGRRWATTEVWTIPCPHGDFEFTTAWEPKGIRLRRGQTNKEQLSPLNDLRPISRSDAQSFADIANHRNQSESFNHWYKSRLYTKNRRAATLSIEGQVLDYLGGACLRNALTWANWRADD
ncbi:hypothetical protein AB0N29_19670 [Nocardioides sp. NPDC092400]|uniref:hypothetical protein n=1 Tax=Nocardioides sp. NPDC092400 TaxID=3155196 RepID=UPI003443A1C6